MTEYQVYLISDEEVEFSLIFKLRKDATTFIKAVKNANQPFETTFIKRVTDESGYILEETQI